MHPPPSLRLREWNGVDVVCWKLQTVLSIVECPVGRRSDTEESRQRSSQPRHPPRLQVAIGERMVEGQEPIQTQRPHS